MPTLLIVTRHTPLPWEDGAGAYLHDVARFLARHGFRVEVLWLAPHDHLRWQKVWRLPEAFDPAVTLHLPGARRFGRRYLFLGVIWLPFKAHCLHYARRALRLIGLNPPRRSSPPAQPAEAVAASPTSALRSWMSPPSPAELALVQRFSEKHRPDVVMASYAWICPILALPALRHARHACLAHDVIWKRAALALDPAGNERPAVTRDDEATWLRLADVIVAISEADAREFREFAPAAHILVAPKALEKISAGVTGGETQRLLFVGSDNAFNAEGIEWFLLTVWPLIRQAVPAAKLDLCGTINRSVTLRADGVTFHGAVASLDGFYQRAALAIVPLLRATGMNIKLVEAAAAGRAIVATPVTLLGAPFLHNAVISANTPAEFAAAVVRLLLDPVDRARAAHNALAAVKAHLTPTLCYGDLATELAPAR